MMRMTSMTRMTRMPSTITTPETEEEKDDRRAKKKEHAAEYYKANADKVNARVRDYRKRLPHKRSAHLAVKRALHNGALTRPAHCVGDTGTGDLEQCERKPEAHHDDYDHELTVLWLCRRHHRQRHEHLRSQGRDPD